MSEVSLVLLSAGESSRFNSPIKKQWIRIGDMPLWQYVAKKFQKKYDFEKIIIVAKDEQINYMKKIDDSFVYVKGGNLRQNSLKNALEFVNSEYVLVSDVARAKIPKKIIKKLLKKKDDFDCVSPYLSVSDTSYLNDTQIKREDLKLIQTPQLSKTDLLKKALEKDEIFTDDSSAVKSVGGKIGFIKGSTKAKKITFKKDLEFFKFKKTSKDIFSGNGFDIHALKSGEFITLCGIKIPCEFSFIAHSDGDVAIHALIDAIFGACGLGDIGEFFPDTDEKYKNIDSKILLTKCVQIINSYGFELVNVDLTIVAQSPKLSKFKDEMRRSLEKVLKIKKINIKATTAENLGFLGRKEGICAIANANLKYFDWKKL